MNKQFALRVFAASLVVGAWMSAPQSVQAQGNSLFGGSGLTKSGTGGISGSMMGTGFGSTSGSSAGRGGAGGALGGALGGASQFGGQGQSPFGGTSGGMGANPFGTTGANNSGMVGRNSGAFAGNSQAGQTGANAGRATRNFGNGGNAGQRGNNGRDNSPPERTTSMIRPRQRVAFEFDAKTPVAVATKMTTRMVKISRKNPSLKGVEIKVDGEDIVLTGKVKTAEQSRLAAILLRQEPGVKSIRNELVVEQPTATE